MLIKDPVESVVEQGADQVHSNVARVASKHT